MARAESGSGSPLAKTLLEPRGGFASGAESVGEFRLHRKWITQIARISVGFWRIAASRPRAP